MKDELPYMIIPATNNPLSAEVFIIRGKTHTYFFDCGNNRDVIKKINCFPNKEFIISHFHEDHIGNHNLIDGKFYISKFDEKYFLDSKTVLVEKQIEINDRIKLLITSIPSTHAKGSLILTLNSTYTFLGDSTYGTMKKGQFVYNAQLLEQEIAILEKIETVYFIRSHEDNKLIPKAQILNELNFYLSLRNKNSPLIMLE